MTEKAQDEDTRSIQAEYLQWRKNIQFIYSALVNHALDWPALSVQWLPGKECVDGNSIQNLLISTHTSDKEDEFLQILSVTMPNEVTEDMISKDAGTRVRVLKNIRSRDEVNKAQYNPFSPNIVATRSDKPEVLIYDIQAESKAEDSPNPISTLRGHKSGGYGLDWNTIGKNVLISSGEDGIVCYFDLSTGGGGDVECVARYERHESIVNDVCFSFHNQNIFASVGDDKRIIVWDKRDKEPLIIQNGHDSDVLCIQFNPLSEALFATGGADSTVKVWDSRNTESPLFTLVYHADGVSQVKWSPHFESVLASASTDRRVCLWDVSKTGEQQLAGDSNEGPPELAFLHGGHTNAVTDIAWNPLEKWEIASVAEDNILQIWSMSRQI